MIQKIEMAIITGQVAFFPLGYDEDGRLADNPYGDRLPAERIDVTEIYDELMDGQAAGKIIMPPDADNAEPWLAILPPPSTAELINAELAELQAYLTSTDYIAIKIAEGVATKEDYTDELAKRQESRDRINALCDELAELEAA